MKFRCRAKPSTTELAMTPLKTRFEALTKEQESPALSWLFTRLKEIGN